MTLLPIAEGGGGGFMVQLGNKMHVLTVMLSSGNFNEFFRSGHQQQLGIRM